MRVVYARIDETIYGPPGPYLPGRTTAAEVRVVLNRPERLALLAARRLWQLPQAAALATFGPIACRWLNRHNRRCRGDIRCWNRNGTWPEGWI